MCRRQSWYVTCNCKAAPGFPHGCTTGCPQGPHKPRVKCVCAKPRVPLGCPPCSQNASPATVWWGAPRAVPWGIINIKREETDRGAPLFPHAGQCWAPMFPQRPLSRDIDGRPCSHGGPSHVPTWHAEPTTELPHCSSRHLTACRPQCTLVVPRVDHSCQSVCACIATGWVSRLRIFGVCFWPEHYFPA